MPIAKINDREYLAKQYRNASNLKTRLSLHQRFSINPYGWHRWVFDKFNLPPVRRILELGCGPGTLWSENIERIPIGWEIILSDFSAGMVKEASSNLEKYPQFQFRVIDRLELAASHAVSTAVDKPGFSNSFS